MNIVICGSRKFDDYKRFQYEIDTLIDTFINNGYKRSEIVLISGGADGADSMARTYWKKYNFTHKEFLADWDNLDVPNVVIKKNKAGKLYNALAGHNRNTQMLDIADLCVAFWDGRSPGTKDMINKCKKRNIQLMVVDV